MIQRHSTRAMLVTAVVLGFAPIASGQLLPWDQFIDTVVGSDGFVSDCDVINADNVELVLLSSTSQLVIVGGRDVTLEDTFVTADNDVIYLGQPAGFLSYETDGDGFRTVWWITLTGRVIAVDGFTGEPSETDSFPRDFVNVRCDACALWDDPTVCIVPPDPDDDPDDEPTIDLCGTDVPLATTMAFIVLLPMRLVRSRRRTSAVHQSNTGD